MKPARSHSPPPLPRHPCLQPLSREHFGGLVLARNLLRASEQDGEVRRRALESFLAAWRGELAPHFHDEELLLGPIITGTAAHDRLLAEHRSLRAFAEEAGRLPATFIPDPSWLRRLAEQLHDHIRWEERSLFPAAEAVMSDAAATTIARYTRAIEAQRPGAKRRQDMCPPSKVPGAYAQRTSHQQEPRMDNPPSDRPRPRPSERFEPDQALFDLRTAAAELRAEPTAPHAGHRQKVLYRRGGATVALFVFDQDARLAPHQTSGAVTIQGIDGELRIRTDDQEHVLRAGTVVALAPRVRHEVLASEPSTMLLTVHLDASADADLSRTP